MNESGHDPAFEDDAGGDLPELWVEGDRLAKSVLVDLAPLTFSEVVLASERRLCFHLRHQAIKEFQLGDARPSGDGLERDEFDSQAVHILGRDAGEAVATCRLVLPSQHRPLPVETEFDLRVPIRPKALEIGRVVVTPGYRGDGHSVLLGLIARSWLSMRARGFNAAIGATPARIIGLLHALGFSVDQLGPPRTYWGEERYPILCKGESAISGVAEMWRKGAPDLPLDQR